MGPIPLARSSWRRLTFPALWALLVEGRERVATQSSRIAAMRVAVLMEQRPPAITCRSVRPMRAIVTIRGPLIHRRGKCSDACFRQMLRPGVTQLCSDLKSWQPAEQSALLLDELEQWLPHLAITPSVKLQARRHWPPRYLRELRLHRQ